MTAVLTRGPLEGEKDDKKADAKARLQAFFESGAVDAWVRTRRYLHAFSLTNQVLILMQSEEGERIDGVQAAWRWKKAGYHPVKGSKAIYVWAPQTRAKDKDGMWTCRHCTQRGNRAARCIACGQRRETVFRLKPVFGPSRVVSFEDGSAPPPPPSPAPLEGFSHERNLDALLDSEFVSNLEAVELIRFADPDDDPVLLVAGGYFKPSKRLVVIRKGPPNRMLATLVHELAHAMGVSSIGDGYSREQAEAIVECAAFLTSDALGLDIGDRSMAYIAGWAGADGTPPWQILQTHMKLIDSLARDLTAAATPIPEEDDDA